MTHPGRPISEDELHAYVDGLLDPGGRLEVERYLEAYPAVAQRVAAYNTQREDLRAAFAEQNAEPLPSSLNLARLVEERLTRPRRPWLAAASVVLALGIGGAGGWLLGERPATGVEALVQEAAASYAVYASDARRPVELWAGQRDDLVRWLSNRLNRPIAPPDLSVAGYQLLGGRLVATGHGPAALFIYEDARGKRLALFVRPMAAAHTQPIEPVDIGTMDGCAWIERGNGYIVVAAESYGRLLEIAQHVRQQAEARVEAITTARTASPICGLTTPGGGYVVYRHPVRAGGLALLVRPAFREYRILRRPARVVQIDRPVHEVQGEPDDRFRAS